MKHGYTRELLVLPFDHRASFQEKLFGIKGTPTAEQTELISSYKTMIYEGFEKAVKTGLPKENMGILVDEQFGQEVIRRCKRDHVTLSICAEKSGQEEFDFEHGKDWQKAIDQVSPDILKVLVRYNPGSADKAMNERQAARLAELGRFLAKTNRKYMFELLVPPTPEQLATVGGDKAKYDLDVRPKLMIQAIHELQKAGVEADIWKIEGLDRESDFAAVVKAARDGGRDEVACIVLGRGENEKKVLDWLKVGAHTKGVVGFAVGRTIFWEPLKEFKDGKITKDEATDKIAKNYERLCRFWINEKG